MYTFIYIYKKTGILMLQQPLQFYFSVPIDSNIYNDDRR